jgi:Domain of unknown function (DUF4209)
MIQVSEFYKKIKIEDIATIDLSQIKAASIKESTLAEELNALAEIQSTESSKEIYQLISDCIKLGYQIDNDEVPFRSFVEWEGKRTINLSDLTSPHVEVLKKASSVTTNFLLKSKFADIVWCKDRKNHSFGAEAIQSYIALVNQAFAQQPAEIFEYKTYLERSLKIAYALGKFDDNKKSFFDLINLLVDRNKDEAQGASRFYFLDLGVKYRVLAGDPTISQAIESWSETALQNNDFEKAKKYLDLLSKIARQEKKKDDEKSFRERRAMIFVDEAKKMKAQKASPLILENLYTKAIYELRQIGRMRNLIDDLHNELVEIQKETNEHMKSHEVSFDPSDLIREARAKIEGRSTLEALVVLSARYGTPPSRAQLLENARRLIQQSPLQFMIGRTIVNNKGRVVARSAGGSNILENENLEMAVFQELGMGINIKGTVAEVLRQDLLSKLDFTQDNFSEILNSNPVVPAGRKKYFAKAIWYGFQGQWIECLHIMIPQIENSIRQYLEDAGYLTELISDELTQEQKSLSAILEKPFCSLVFGEDMVCYWRFLYTDQRGNNLRNLLAHGLYDGADIPAEIGVMCWLNFMHYLLLGARSRIAKIEVARSSTVPNDPGGSGSDD